MANSSKIIKARSFDWEGIEKRDYKNTRSAYKDVHRYNLLGIREDEQQLNFQTRYFEIQSGGYTTCEYHRHPHSVIIIRGKGSMILQDEIHQLEIHDVIYIAPDALHQFHADRGEPLGFICTVDRYRDRPSLPDKKYLEQNLTDKKVRAKIRQ